MRLRPPGRDPYAAWLEREREPIAPESNSQELRLSLLLPVYRPQREWLEEAVASVRNQTYSNWELCICDDASPEDWLTKFFDSITASDPRVRVFRATTNLGISGALNQASTLATGHYLAGLDQDDRLSAEALAALAAAVQDSGADLVYSDEDRIDESGRRAEPIFKPDWSPDLLLSCMYMGHLMAFSRAAWDRAGGLRSEYDGAQDYDLALRLTDDPIKVRHVGRVLYHWRRHAGSTAADPQAKPYTHAAGKKALEDALRRRGALAKVEDGPRSNLYRVRWEPQGTPLASLIICSRSAQLLRQCLEAVAGRTSYSRLEVIVVQHIGHEDDGLQAVIQAFGARVVPYAGSFHFSRMNNLGARDAAGDVLVFLNDDIEPLDATWLERLIGQVEGRFR
jgi:GT2 family glycosyltransferase